MAPERRKVISIISAVFNEEATIPIFYERLSKAVAPYRDRYDFELIFTNNASRDRTAEIVARLRESDPSVQMVTLSRNFGYQASLQSGLTYAAGDAIVIIDVDCEDPPEMIPQFIQHWEAGHDVVYGSRVDRPEAWIVRQLRALFYYVLRYSADMDVVLYMAEFSLITAEVRRAILDNQSTFPFLRSEIGYAGFSRYGIRYRREKRVAGETHYNFLRMWSFAIGGILTTSTFVMRVAVYLWPGLVLLNLVLFGMDLRSRSALGFRAAVLVDLLYLITMLTLHGLYLARVYKDGISRPNFIVNEKKSLLNRSFPRYRGTGSGA